MQLYFHASFVAGKRIVIVALVEIEIDATTWCSIKARRP
jgi:hypothetical protein